MVETPVECAWAAFSFLCLRTDNYRRCLFFQQPPDQYDGVERFYL